MDEIYLSGFHRGGELFLPTVSVITLFTKEYCRTKAFHFCLVSAVNSRAVYPVVIPLSSFASAPFSNVEKYSHIFRGTNSWPASNILHGFRDMLRQIFHQPPSSSASVLSIEDCPHSIQNCALPALRCHHSNTVLSGLCAVLRHMLKVSATQENTPDLLQLLGHKEMCLKACADISHLTKLCEVDMPNVVDQIFSNPYTEAGDIKIPDELMKLERWFRSLCDKANKNKKPRGSSEARCREVDVNNSHGRAFQNALKYSNVQDQNITLADIALLPCIALILNNWKDNLSQVNEYLPLTLQWLDHLCNMNNVDAAFTSVHLIKPLFPNKHENLCNTIQELHIDSLCNRQTKMKKCNVNLISLQSILKKISALPVSSLRSQLSHDVHVDWQNLPEAVYPNDDLPKERMKKKCQQLDNLATAVMMMVKSGDTVVDFCSGSGHLGILLAYLLPDCMVVLVENKEELVRKAQARITQLQLRNVTLYQCNLVYFTGKFDIGVCLHACGAATDLVLQRCLNNKASFVICPCCYGKIRYCHSLTYPRSNLFRKAGLTLSEYLRLGHVADHARPNNPLVKQGRLCMMYIDVDRAHLAMEHDYRVTLATLKPPECSVKNNLLIGRINSC